MGGVPLLLLRANETDMLYLLFGLDEMKILAMF